MSQGYGYVRMQFTKEDGSADVEMAKKVYEYCTKHYDFFNTTDGRFQAEADAEEDADWEDRWIDYGDAFYLAEEEIGSAYKGDGLYIDGSAANALDEDWIQEVYEEFKPYQMKVQFHQDYSESSYDSNTIERYKVVERDGNRKLENCEVLYFTNGAAFDYDNGHFIDDGGGLYILIDEDYELQRIMAKNKKTGRIIELYDEVFVRVEQDEDGDDVLYYRDIFDEDGNEVQWIDEGTYYDYKDSIQDLVDDEEITLEAGESADYTEWSVYADYCPACEKFFYLKPTDASVNSNAPESSDASGNESTSSTAAGTVKCPNCGTENPAGMSFCETCGTKLTGSTVAERAGRPSIEERMNKMQADMDAKLDSFFRKK